MRDVPDECESERCNEPPDIRLDYTDPPEKIYYCKEHGARKAVDKKVINITPV